MRYLLIILLLLPILASGQGTTSFGATRAQDTSFTNGQVRYKAYTSGDTTICVLLTNGTMKTIPITRLAGTTYTAGYGLGLTGFQFYVDTSVTPSQYQVDTALSNRVKYSDSLSLYVTTSSIARGTIMGTIINDSFKRSSIGSDYTSSLATATLTFPSDNYAQLNGGSNTFTNYIKHNDYTALTRTTLKICFIPTVVDGTSYGMGIGLVSKRNPTNASIVARVVTDNSSSAGKIYLHKSNAASTPFDSSSTSLSFSVNDSLECYMVRYDTSLTVVFKNATTDDSITKQYGWNTSSTSNVSMPNTSQPTIFQFGGDNIVYNFSYSCQSNKHNDTYISDSELFGYTVTQQSKSAINRMYSNKSDFTYTGGPSDRSYEMLLRLQEVSDHFPARLFINIGFADRTGTPIDTFVKNMETSIHYFTGLATPTYVISLPPRTGVDNTTFNDSLQAVCKREGVPYIDIFNPLKGVGTDLNILYDSGDGIHWNDSGNYVVSQVILPYTTKTYVGNLGIDNYVKDYLLKSDSVVKYVTPTMLNDTASALRSHLLSNYLKYSDTTSLIPTKAFVANTYVPLTRTINGLALTSDLSIGLTSVTTEDSLTAKSITIGMETQPASLSFIAGTRFQMFNTSNQAFGVIMGAGDVVNGTGWIYRKARGTLDVPTAVAASDIIHYDNYESYTGVSTTSRVIGATFNVLATATATATDAGTRLVWTTAPSGSTTRRNRIETDATGNVLLNSGGFARTIISNTTDDGSGRELQVTGQVGATDTIRTSTVMQEAGITSAILKTNASGVHAAAVASTDYVPPTTAVNGQQLTGSIVITSDDVPNDDALTGAGTYNIPATAGTIYISFTGTTATWTLPTLASSEHASYFIKNRGSGDITINSNAGGNDIYNTSAVNTFTIASGQSYIIHNDGTFFNIE